LNYVKSTSKPIEIKFDWFGLNWLMEKIEPIYLVWIKLLSLSYHYFDSYISYMIFLKDLSHMMFSKVCFIYSNLIIILTGVYSVKI